MPINIERFCLGTETVFDQECFVHLTQLSMLTACQKQTFVTHLGTNVTVYTINHRRDEKEVPVVHYGFRQPPNGSLMHSERLPAVCPPANMREICSLVPNKYERQVGPPQMSGERRASWVSSSFGLISTLSWARA
jgi:hypothetical protein